MCVKVLIEQAVRECVRRSPFASYFHGYCSSREESAKEEGRTLSKYGTTYCQKKHCSNIVNLNLTFQRRRFESHRQKAVIWEVIFSQLLTSSTTFCTHSSQHLVSASFQCRYHLSVVRVFVYCWLVPWFPQSRRINIRSFWT